MIPVITWTNLKNVVRKSQTQKITCRGFFYVCAQSRQSYLTLCDSIDCGPPGSTVHGILPWVAMPSFRGSSQSRDRIYVFCITGRSFTIETNERTDWKIWELITDDKIFWRHSRWLHNTEYAVMQTSNTIKNS